MLQKLHIVILVMMSPQQHTHLYLPKMKNASFVAPESNRLSCASAVKCQYIYSHPLNEQQEQITIIPEGGKFRFYPLNGEGLEPILLPWKCYSGHSMEVCDESNNCTKFFSSELEITAGHRTLSDQILNISDQFHILIGHDVRTFQRHNWLLLQHVAYL